MKCSVQHAHRDADNPLPHSRATCFNRCAALAPSRALCGPFGAAATREYSVVVNGLVAKLAFSAIGKSGQKIYNVGKCKAWLG